MTLRPLHHFVRDQRGLAAVEFALLAPFLIVIYFGLVELCTGYMAKKRVGHATATVADLTSQQQWIGTSNLDDIANIGVTIMKPFSETPLSLRVSGVTRTGGQTIVNWSWVKNRGDNRLPPHRDGAQVTVPDGMIQNGESLIMSEALYEYQSPLKTLLPGLTKFRAAYYLRPRISNQTTCTDCPSNP